MGQRNDIKIGGRANAFQFPTMKTDPSLTPLSPARNHSAACQYMDLSPLFSPGIMTMAAILSNWRMPK